jgi:hypothetical protein
MGVDDDRPPDPSLQPSTHPSSWLGNKSKNRKHAAAPPARVCSRDESDFSDPLLAHPSKIGQSFGICGRGSARQDSASQQPYSSKEWMFQGNVAVPNVSKVDWDNVNDPVSDEVRKGFPEVGGQLKATFSENSPA